MFEDEYRSMTVSDAPPALPNPQTQTQRGSKNSCSRRTAECAGVFTARSRVTKCGWHSSLFNEAHYFLKMSIQTLLYPGK